MSLTSPDFESGAYTNFSTPAAIGEVGHAILGADLPIVKEANADFPSSLPPLKHSEGRKIRAQSAVKERLPIMSRCYTILGPAKSRPRTPQAQHHPRCCPKRDSQLF